MKDSKNDEFKSIFETPKMEKNIRFPIFISPCNSDS